MASGRAVSTDKRANPAEHLRGRKATFMIDSVAGVEMSLFLQPDMNEGVVDMELKNEEGVLLMHAIIDVHYPGIKQRLVSEALKLFYEIREVPGMKKKPSTSELLDWLKLLMVEDITPETLRERDPKNLIPPLHGALLKNEQDVHLFERLAFMTRREGR